MVGGAELRRDGVLRTLAALAVVIVGLFVARVGSVQFRLLTFWVIQVVLDIIFVVFGGRVAGTLHSPSPRRFWRLVTFAGLFFTVGDGWETVTASRRPEVSVVAGGEKQAFAVLIGVGITVFAMATYPIEVRGRRERLKWWLDAATVLVAVSGYVWVGFVARRTEGNPVPLSVLLLSASLSLLAAFGVMRLMLGGNAPFTATAGIAAGIASILITASTAFAIVPTTAGGFTVITLLRLLPCILLAATPRILEVQLRVDPDLFSHRKLRAYSRSPYLALLATQTLLILQLARGDISARVWGVVAAVVAGTGLVVGRQLVAFADNSRLLSSLDRTSLDLRRQEERTRSLVQQASDITIVARGDGRVSYISPATSRVLGRPPEEFLGRQVREFVHPEDRAELSRMAGTLLRRPNTPITTDLRVQRQDGSWRSIEVIGTNLLADPNVEGIIGNLRDVTEARQFGERLRHEATHDPLTGLANRALLDERIRVDPAAGLMPEEPVAMLTVDLDDFKSINDTRGHAVGDGLLNVVSDRLVHSVRAVDTVARVGGDEFAILLPGASPTLAADLAARVLGVFSEPFYIDGNQLNVHASIGVAVGQREDAEVLLRASDLSMYKAKQQGKGKYVMAGR